MNLPQVTEKKRILLTKRLPLQLTYYLLFQHMEKVEVGI